jgi:hypothetical protein
MARKMTEKMVKIMSSLMVRKKVVKMGMVKAVKKEEDKVSKKVQTIVV